MEPALNRYIVKVTVNMSPVCGKMNSTTKKDEIEKLSQLSETHIHHSSLYVGTKMEKNGKKNPKDKKGPALLYYDL